MRGTVAWGLLGARPAAWLVVVGATTSGCGASKNAGEGSGHDASGGGATSGGATNGGATNGGATSGGRSGSNTGGSPMGGAGGDEGGAAGAAGDPEGGEGGQPPDPPCDEGTFRCLGDVGVRESCIGGQWASEAFTCAVSVRVENGGGAACATKADGRVHCWDHSGYSMLPPAPTFSGIVRAVLGGQDAARSWDNTLFWLENGTLWTYTVRAVADIASFERDQLSGDVCVVRRDGSADCEVTDLAPVTPPEPARFRQVVVSGNDLCSLDDMGNVRCRFSTLSGRYAELALGTFLCARTLDGAIECVSPAGVELGFPVPAGTFTRIAMADDTVCGIRDSGDLACAGMEGQVPEPPSGPYTDIDGGDRVLCAIHVDGSVRCFSTYGPEIAVPEGW